MIFFFGYTEYLSCLYPTEYLLCLYHTVAHGRDSHVQQVTLMFWTQTLADVTDTCLRGQSSSQVYILAIYISCKDKVTDSCYTELNTACYNVQLLTNVFVELDSSCQQTFTEKRVEQEEI